MVSLASASLYLSDWSLVVSTAFCQSPPVSNYNGLCSSILALVKWRIFSQSSKELYILYWQSHHPWLCFNLLYTHHASVSDVTQYVASGNHTGNLISNTPVPKCTGCISLLETILLRLSNYRRHTPTHIHDYRITSSWAAVFTHLLCLHGIPLCVPIQSWLTYFVISAWTKVNYIFISYSLMYV